MGFDPCNCIIKIQESIWDSNSKHGSVKVHSLTLFALPGICDVTPGSLSWPTTWQPFTLVPSRKVRLQQFKQGVFFEILDC